MGSNNFGPSTTETSKHSKRALLVFSLTHLSFGLWKSLDSPFEALRVLGEAAVVAVGAELGGQEEREVVEDESAVL